VSGAGRIAAGALAAAAAGPAIAALVPPGVLLSLLVQACIYAILALSVGVLARQNGMVSFGHAAMFGAGAYLAGIGLGAPGLLPAEAALLLAVPVVAAVCFGLGLIVVRVHGIAFAMLTLALGQACFEAANKARGVTGGADGLTVALPREIFGLPAATFQRAEGMFLIAWLAMVALAALAALLARSRFGLLTEAIRENEERARFLGYGTVLPRAAVFALSGGIAAAGGVLYVLYNGFVSPETLHWSVSGSALIMALLGGTRTVWGPLAGAAVYFLLREQLVDVTERWLGLLGILLVLVMVFLPDGLSGLPRRLRRQRGAEA